MSRFFYPTLLILLAMAVYVLYTKPLSVEIKHQFTKKAEVEDALVEADKAREQLAEIQKRYESFPQDADEKLDQLLPEKVDPIRLLIDTTAFLERNGFPAQSLSISVDNGGGKSGKSYRKHSIGFTISASYDTFREFLHTLESSLVLRDTSTVSFTADLGDKPASLARPELAIHNYNLQVFGYSLH